MRDLLFVGDNGDEANDVAFHLEVEPVAACHSGLPDFFFAPAFVGVERGVMRIFCKELKCLVNLVLNRRIELIVVPPESGSSNQTHTLSFVRV